MQNNYDLVFTRQELLILKDDQIIKILNRIYPKKKIFSISSDWRYSWRYILKAKGIYGDLIIGWKDRGAVLL